MLNVIVVSSSLIISWQSLVTRASPTPTPNPPGLLEKHGARTHSHAPILNYTHADPSATRLHINDMLTHVASTLAPSQDVPGLTSGEILSLVHVLD